MSDATAIEWTDATWNPIGGCTRVDEGCRNCYAEIMAARFSGPGQWGEGLARMVKGADGRTDHRWTGKMVLHEAALDRPLRWRRPRRIFVNSTSDLFHEFVPDDWIDRVFAVMALCPQHTFQVLTKRPERAAKYLARDAVRRIVGAHAQRLRSRGRGECKTLTAFDIACDRIGLVEAYEHAEIVPKLENRGLARGWPLPNVWLGTSISDQASADARIPHLLACPAAVRFISAEPLLGPVDLTRLVKQVGGHQEWTDAFTGETVFSQSGCIVAERDSLDWVIVGGESGPGARPMHPDWVRSLRDQCVRAGVAFHFKQWGEHEADQIGPEDVRSVKFPPGHVIFRKVGKKAAGRLLDGRTWDQMPGVADA